MNEHVIILDTETTGLDEEQDEVLQVCIRHGLAPDADTQLWCIQPIHHKTIDEAATATHGITIEQTRDWPTFGEVAEQIREHIQRADVIAGYNPDFDVMFLKAEFKRSRCEVKWPPLVVCCKRLWDINEPRPPRDLQAAYRKFVDPAGFEGAHTALADTVATSKVLRSQLLLWAGAKELTVRLPSGGMIDTFTVEKPWLQLDPERATWWGPSRHVVWKDGDLHAGFGRFKGRRWAELDNGFQRWILNKDFPAHVRALAQRAMRQRAASAELKTLVQELNAWALDAARKRGWI